LKIIKNKYNILGRSTPQRVWGGLILTKQSIIFFFFFSCSSIYACKVANTIQDIYIYN
jgi:hypothetical protein